MTKFSHNVFLFQGVNQTAVILLRNKITAVSIHAFLQNARYLTEVGTKCRKHTVFVGIRRSACFLLFFAVCGHRLCDNRCTHRLIHFLFHCIHLLHTFNFGTVILNFLFHLGICFCVLRRKQTVLVSSALYKCLCTFPCLISEFSQF